MKRRSLLQLVGASGIGLLAGCTGEGPAAPSGSETDSATTTPSPSPTASQTASPTDSASPSPSASATAGDVASTSFTVTSNECGTGENRAAGSRDGSTVTVDGVVDGSDTCHSAKLTGATLDDGTLTVAVAAYVPEENEARACGECIVDIAYEATVEFDGTPPDRAVITHDGEQVAAFSLS